MKLVYIGCAADDATIEQLDRVNKQKFNFVQQKWDNAFSEELYRQLGDDFIGFSYPSASAFLLRSSQFYNRETLLKSSNTKLLPCFNILYVKQFHYGHNLAKELTSIAKNGKDVVFVTNSVPFRSSALCEIARKYGAKIITMVPDLPDFDVCEYNSLFGLKGLYKRLKANGKMLFDGYVCFSEHQMRYLNESKPHIVMEGFCVPNKHAGTVNNQSDKFIVMYAGALKTNYGIDKLVAGFHQADIPNSELWIFGGGEYTEVLKRNTDQRIKYMGVKSRDEVLRAEVQASLLVNPRPTDEAFSYLSFPSKLLEYMSSGTPVLTSHLGSIPEEYDNYLKYLPEVSEDAITDCLLSLSADKQLSIFGSAARKFVLENKNISVQTNKVINFAKSIIDNY